MAGPPGQPPAGKLRLSSGLAREPAITGKAKPGLPRALLATPDVRGH